ncbi:hypothetical protein V1512DRAFT_257165 [Lipomyces arxii]|uniref:uncharacterized protein n=1 Tax=Lipomyces arxii TaxID=56418 RepID=UPI0034D00936
MLRHRLSRLATVRAVVSSLKLSNSIVSIQQRQLPEYMSIGLAWSSYARGIHTVTKREQEKTNWSTREGLKDLDQEYNDGDPLAEVEQHGENKLLESNDEVLETVEIDQKPVKNVSLGEKAAANRSTERSSEAYDLAARIRNSTYLGVANLYEEMKPTNKDSWGADPDFIGRAFITRFLSTYLPASAAHVWTDMEQAGMLENYSVELLNSHLMATARIIADVDRPGSDKRQTLEALFKKFIDAREVSRDTYTVLLDSYFRIGERDLAMRCYRDIQKGKIRCYKLSGEMCKSTSDNSYTVTVRDSMVDVMLKYMLKSEDVAAAEEIFQDGRQRIKLRPVAYNTLASYYVKKDNIERAQEILELMSQDGVQRDAATYATILYATFHQVYLSTAASKSDRPWETNNNRREESEAIVDAAKQSLKAILQEMRDDRVAFTPHVLHTMTVGLIDIGRDMEMADTFLASGAKLVPIQRKTIVAYMQGHVRKGSARRAVVLYKDILSKMHIRQTSYDLNNIVKRLVSENDSKLAFELFFNITARTNRTLTQKPDIRTMASLYSAAEVDSSLLLELEKMIAYMEANQIFPPTGGYLHRKLLEFGRAGGNISSSYLSRLNGRKR